MESTAFEIDNSRLKSIVAVSALCAVAVGIHYWASPKYIFDLALSNTVPKSRAPILNSVSTIEDARKLSLILRSMSLFLLVPITALILRGVIFTRVLTLRDDGSGEIILILDKFRRIEKRFVNQYPKLSFQNSKVKFMPPLQTQDSKQVNSLFFGTILTKDSVSTISKKIDNYNKLIGDKVIND